MPVSIVAWLGSVYGLTARASSNTTASAAKRSRYGVVPRTEPYTPMWSARTVSIEMRITWGRSEEEQPRSGKRARARSQVTKGAR